MTPEPTASILSCMRSAGDCMLLAAPESGDRSIQKGVPSSEKPSAQQAKKEVWCIPHRWFSKGKNSQKRKNYIYIYTHIYIHKYIHTYIHHRAFQVFVEDLFTEHLRIDLGFPQNAGLSTKPIRTLREHRHGITRGSRKQGLAASSNSSPSSQAWATSLGKSRAPQNARRDTCRSLRKKKEPKPKLFGPDIFQWGGGLPREWVGAKKFDISLETRETKLFGRGIPGFCRDIPGVPEKFEKKEVYVQFPFPNPQKPAIRKNRGNCGFQKTPHTEIWDKVRSVDPRFVTRGRFAFPSARNLRIQSMSRFSYNSPAIFPELPREPPSRSKKQPQPS